MNTNLEFQFRTLLTNAQFSQNLQDSCMRILSKLTEADAVIVYCHLYENPETIADFFKVVLRKAEYIKSGQSG